MKRLMAVNGVDVISSGSRSDVIHTGGSGFGTTAGSYANDAADQLTGVTITDPGAVALPKRFYRVGFWP